MARPTRPTPHPRARARLRRSPAVAGALLILAVALSGCARDTDPVPPGPTTTPTSPATATATPSPTGQGTPAPTRAPVDVVGQLAGSTRLWQQGGSDDPYQAGSVNPVGPAGDGREYVFHSWSDATSPYTATLTAVNTTDGTEKWTRTYELADTPGDGPAPLAIRVGSSIMLTAANQASEPGSLNGNTEGVTVVVVDAATGDEVARHDLTVEPGGYGPETTATGVFLVLPDGEGGAHVIDEAGRLTSVGSYDPLTDHWAVTVDGEPLLLASDVLPGLFGALPGWRPGDVDTIVQVTSERAVRVSGGVNQTDPTVRVGVFDPDLNPVGEPLVCAQRVPYGDGAALAPVVSPTGARVAVGAAVVNPDTGEGSCLSDLSDEDVRVVTVGDDGSAWVVTGDDQVAFVDAAGRPGAAAPVGGDGRAGVPAWVLPGDVHVVVDRFGTTAGVSAP